MEQRIGLNVRFYVKHMGRFAKELGIGNETWALYHRLSHTYLAPATFDTPEELADYIRELNACDPETFWHTMLFEYKVRMPHRDVLRGLRKDDGWVDSEELLQTQWYLGTQKFYEMFPDCLVEEEVDFDLVNRVYTAEMERRRREEEERRKPKRKVVLENGRLRIKLFNHPNPFAYAR